MRRVHRRANHVLIQGLGHRFGRSAIWIGCLAAQSRSVQPFCFTLWAQVGRRDWREGEEREHLRAVLLDGAIAHLAIAELAFYDAEDVLDVLDLRPHIAETAVPRALAFREIAPGLRVIPTRVCLSPLMSSFGSVQRRIGRFRARPSPGTRSARSGPPRPRRKPRLRRSTGRGHPPNRP
jgi:hypothetical protein